MPNKRGSSQSRSLIPTAVGMGLLALDLVIPADADAQPCTYAGGTCGNVLTILGFLGWKAYPISRLGKDKAAERVVADLQHWKVSTEFVTKQSDGSTPVIVQRIRQSANGIPQHSFSWRCPGCGSHLPGYKPILASAVDQIALRIRPSQVFFFDRVSRSSLLMAKLSRKRGAVVVFEPAGIGEPALFREAWGTAHIVKYAHERLSDLGEVELPESIRNSILLEIETCGSEGLRFRSQLPYAKTNGWSSVPALSISRLKDTAGSGDWCTAGVLDALARNGVDGLKRVSVKKLQYAMEHGQAMAAWNCEFEGARGGMYKQDHKQFVAAIKRILKGTDSPSLKDRQEKGLSQHYLPQLCRLCNETGSNRKVVSRRKALL